MSDDRTVQAGVRINLMSSASEVSQTALVGTVRAKCRFAALPRPGDEIATANLTGVSVGTADIGMRLFLRVDKVQHFTDGPEDPKPEVWVVTSMDAPHDAEECLALAAAFGERGWLVDGYPRSGHPWSGAVETWKTTRI